MNPDTDCDTGFEIPFPLSKTADFKVKPSVVKTTKIFVCPASGITTDGTGMYLGHSTGLPFGKEVPSGR